MLHKIRKIAANSQYSLFKQREKPEQINDQDLGIKLSPRARKVR